MEIPCFRCGKMLSKANDTNADYIIAPATMAREFVDVLTMVKHNDKTKAKLEKMREKDENGDLKYPDLAISPEEYDEVEIQRIEDAVGKDLIRVTSDKRLRDVQKTGLICPDCYKPTDFIIWGIHKTKEVI